MSLENYLSAKSRDRYSTSRRQSTETEHQPLETIVNRLSNKNRGYSTGANSLSNIDKPLPVPSSDTDNNIETNKDTISSSTEYSGEQVEFEAFVSVKVNQQRSSSRLFLGLFPTAHPSSLFPSKKSKLRNYYLKLTKCCLLDPNRFDYSISIHKDSDTVAPLFKFSIPSNLVAYRFVDEQVSSKNQQKHGSLLFFLSFQLDNLAVTDRDSIFICNESGCLDILFRDPFDRGLLVDLIERARVECYSISELVKPFKREDECGFDEVGHCEVVNECTSTEIVEQDVGESDKGVEEFDDYSNPYLTTVELLEPLAELEYQQDNPVQQTPDTFHNANITETEIFDCDIVKQDVQNVSVIAENDPNLEDIKALLHELNGRLEANSQLQDSYLTNQLQSMRQTILQRLDTIEAALNSRSSTTSVGLEAIADSLSKISEFLSRNVDLQNQSESTIHAKIDSLVKQVQTIANTKQAGIPSNSDNSDRTSTSSELASLKIELAAIGRKLAADHSLENQRNKDQTVIEKLIRDRTGKLLDICQSVQSQVHSISSGSTQNQRLESIDKRLENIQTGLDQTQSMVLSSTTSASQPSVEDALKRLSTISENLNGCINEFNNSLNSSYSRESSTKKDVEFESSIVKDIESLLEQKLSGFEKKLQGSEPVDAIVTEERNSRREEYHNHHHRGSPIATRARSLSPMRKMYDDNAQELNMEDINRNLGTLKTRLNSFISSTLSDNRIETIANQIRVVQEVSEKTRKELQSLNENFHRSDQSWKTELRQSMRLSQDKMLKLEQILLLGETNITNNKNGDKPDSLEQDTSRIGETIIVDTINGNFAALSEEMQQMQDLFQRQFQTYSQSLHDLMQDREVLMRENQSLLTKLNKTECVDGESGDEIKSLHHDISHLRREKDELSREIEQRLNWLERIKQ